MAGSVRKNSMKSRTNHFVPPYTAPPGYALSPATDDMVMTYPDFCPMNAGSTAATPFRTPLMFTAIAQSKMDDMKGMDMAKKPAATAPIVHKAMGPVKKVDAKAGVVTLAHEPIKSLNWPSMTMGFKVKDKMLMDTLTAGKKVKFEFVQEDKDYVITGVK